MLVSLDAVVKGEEETKVGDQGSRSDPSQSRHVALSAKAGGKRSTTEYRTVLINPPQDWTPESAASACYSSLKANGPQIAPIS